MKKISKNDIFIEALDYFDWSRAKEFLTQNRLADIDEAVAYTAKELAHSLRSNYYGDSNEHNKTLIEAVDKKNYYSPEFWSKLKGQSSESIASVLDHLLCSDYIENKFSLMKAVEESENKDLKKRFFTGPYFRAFSQALSWGYQQTNAKINILNTIDNSFDFHSILQKIEENYDSSMFKNLQSYGLLNFKMFKEALDRTHPLQQELFQAECLFYGLYQQSLSLPNKVLVPQESQFVNLFSRQYYERQADERVAVIQFYSQPQVLALESPEILKSMALTLFNSTVRQNSYSNSIQKLTPPLYKYLERHLNREDVLEYLNSKNNLIRSGEEDHSRFHFLQELHHNKVLNKLENMDFWEYLTKKMNQKEPHAFIAYFKEFFEPQKLEQLFESFCPDNRYKGESFLDRLSDFTLRNQKYQASLSNWTSEAAKIQFLNSFFFEDLSVIVKKIELLPQNWINEYPDQITFIKQYAKSFLRNESQLKDIFKNPDYKFLIKDADLIEKSLKEGWGQEYFEFASGKYKTIASDETLNDLFLQNIKNQEKVREYDYAQYAGNAKNLFHNSEHTARLCDAHPTLYKYLDEHRWREVSLVSQMIVNLSVKKSPEETLQFLKTHASRDVAQLFSVIENKLTQLPKEEQQSFDVLGAYSTIIEELKKKPPPKPSYHFK